MNKYLNRTIKVKIKNQLKSNKCNLKYYFQNHTKLIAFNLFCCLPSSEIRE